MAGTSVVVSAQRACARNHILLNVLGGCCMPLCSVGITCCVVGSTFKSFSKNYKHLIGMYGGKLNMHRIATMIRQEMEIFKQAVAKVNMTVNPVFIVGDTTILDMVLYAEPVFSAAYMPHHLMNTVSRCSSNSTYCNVLLTEYLSLGGNYNVIIYGLVEYLCMLYDPTCTVVENVLVHAVGDTVLHVEMMAHKSKAGF